MDGILESIRTLVRSGFEGVIAGEDANPENKLVMTGADGLIDPALLPASPGNSGSITVEGAFDFVTATDMVLTLSAIDLATDVTGLLPLANLAEATVPSVLLGRNSSTTGPFQEITLGDGFVMSGTELRVITWIGAYDNGVTYTPLSIVSYNGGSYISEVETTGNLPTDTDFWAPLVTKGDQGIQGIQGEAGADGNSLVPAGAWQLDQSYSVLDIVTYFGSSYLCTTAHTSVNTPDTLGEWMLLASIGEPGLPGDAGIQGTQGIQGPNGGIPYVFLGDTAVTIDPGAGNCGLNNSAPASATTLYISSTNAASAYMRDYIQTWITGSSVQTGTLLLVSVNTPATYVILGVTGGTDQTAYFELTVSHIASAGTFPVTDDITLIFVPTGDKGDQGIQGDAGPTGNDGATFNIRSEWTSGGSEYYHFDLVPYSGSSYLCTSQHTSSEPNSPTNNPSYWTLIAAKGEPGADGSNGTGDMSASTYDPATISEQLVGLTATQKLTNKNLIIPVVTYTSSTTLALTDAGKLLICDTTFDSITITVPVEASVAFDIGTQIAFLHIGGNVTVVAPDGIGVTIYSAVGNTANEAGAMFSLVKVGSDVWALTGNLHVV